MSDLRVCFVLIDGLGVGQPDPARNPAARPDLELLSGIAGGLGSGILPLGGRLAPADACLGVEGAPQSATGHSTLLTGINGAKHLGRHQMGLPGRELRTLLAEHSILRSCAEHGRSAAFLNTFGPSFFEFPREKRRRRISATTCATIAAGLPLRDIESNRAGHSVSHDFTNAFLRDEGADLPLRSPAEAGAIVARGSRAHDFVMFEHFLCDRAGHDADAKMAWQVLKDLEQFLNALLGSLDLTRTVLVLASDHGNIEDLLERSHTRNPAAVAIFGPDAANRAAQVHDLTHVAPLMREALGLPKLDLSTSTL
jgi:2,3-bisphosphoglycerate-independent phosphoglycerate mutase